MQGVAAKGGPAVGVNVALPVRRLKLGIAERRGLLMLGDLLIVNGALALVASALNMPTWLAVVYPDEPLNLTWFALLTALWVIVGVMTDSYDLDIAGKRFGSVYHAISAALLTLVLYTLVPYITPPLLKSRLMWAALVGVAVMPLALWRYAYASLLGHPTLHHRALIVGASESGRVLLDALRERPGSGYRVLGFVDDDPERVGGTVDHLPVLGRTADLMDLVHSLGADEVIVATSGAMSSEAYRTMAAAYEGGVRIRSMAQLYEELTERIPIEHVGDHWMAVLPQSSNATASYAVLKRAIDVFGAVLGLLGTALVFLPLAAAILLTSGGPVLYRQQRMGRRGKPFWIYKFRTMPNADSDRSEQTIWERKAGRPTAIGRILRRSRIDELPQFWNVLRGDMSLVGPRPFVPEEVDELQRHIPFFRSRLLVRPGITGWAQVNGGYGTTLQDELLKLQYDLYYIRHQSIALDLFILLKTVSVIFRLVGR